MPLLPWILNAVWALLLTVVSPFVLWRMIRQGRYRRGIAHKLFGRLPVSAPGAEPLWFHAVSVGEVLQLTQVVNGFRQRHPEQPVLISTSTDTGYDVARQRFPNETVTWFPLDFTWSVRRALQRVRPRAVVFVELELWPNFITSAERFGVPLGMINGRLSERSYRGYARLGGLMTRLLECFSFAAMQSEVYADRIRKLGLPQDRVLTTGSIKFDGIQSLRSNPQTTELRQLFGIADDAPVFVAGSTQDPEEQYALATWEELRPFFPGLRLILVPRHPERFDEVAQLVVDRGHTLIRRSQSHEPVTGDGVVLLDTIGELAACWGLADVAFVGGSFGSRGGQNMIEPAGYGAAVLFGPNTRNFRDVVEQLLAVDGAIVVHNGDELTRQVAALLMNKALRTELGHRAREVAIAGRGATERTLDLIDSLLPAIDNSSHRHAA